MPIMKNPLLLIQRSTMPVEKLEEDSSASGSMNQASVPAEAAAVNSTTTATESANVAGEDAKSPAPQQRSGLFSWKRVAKPDDPQRFDGEGVDYRAKLIGIRDVSEPRGDQMCQDAMQLAKAMVKASGQHKQRIVVNISLEGLKIRDATSNQVLYSFPVHRISFIARDVTDARAFGFVFGGMDSEHKFYAIKTQSTSDVVVLAIRDMFHIVYELKKQQIEDAKKGDNADGTTDTKVDQNDNVKTNGVADLLNLQSELQTLQQGIDDLAWVSFPDPANVSVSTSSSGFPSSNLNDTRSSVSDIFGGSHEEPLSTSSGQWAQKQNGEPQQTVTNPFLSASLQFGQQNSALLYGPNSFTSTPTGFGIQSPQIIGATPSAFGDPFQVHHQSTPATMFAQQGNFSSGLGANMTQQLSSIRPDDSSSLFGLSPNVFDVTSGNSNLVNTHTTPQDHSAFNQAMSRTQLNAGMQQSGGGGGGFGASLFDEPLPQLSTGGLADPVSNEPQKKTSLSQQEFTAKSAAQPATIDDAFSSLCNLDSLTSPAAAFKGTVKQSPFDAASKGPAKKSINQMRGGNEMPAAGAPMGGTIPQQQPQQQQFFMPQQPAAMGGANAFLGAAPPTNNPFASTASGFGAAPPPQQPGGPQMYLPQQQAFPGMGLPPPMQGGFQPQQQFGGDFMGGAQQQQAFMAAIPRPLQGQPMAPFAGASAAPVGFPGLPKPPVPNRQPGLGQAAQMPVAPAPLAATANSASFLNDDFFK